MDEFRFGNVLTSGCFFAGFSLQLFQPLRLTGSHRLKHAVLPERNELESVIIVVQFRGIAPRQNPEQIVKAFREAAPNVRLGDGVTTTAHPVLDPFQTVLEGIQSDVMQTDQKAFSRAS